MEIKTVLDFDVLKKEKKDSKFPEVARSLFCGGCVADTSVKNVRPCQ